MLGVAALGQTSRVVQDAGHDPEYPPPYDNSKADQTLKEFDKNHPECELWSDWHKLCSRTGPGGSTYCRLDRDHPTKPSAPFCSKGTSGYSDFATLSPSELRSVRRFVTGYKTVRLQEGHDGRLTARNIKEPIYDPDRPFSGRTIAELEHPYCAVWQIIGGGDAISSLCAEDGRAGMQQCKASKIRTKVSGQPVCVEKVKARICNPDDKKELRVISDLSGNVYNDEGIDQGRKIISSVVGHSCPSRIQQP